MRQRALRLANADRRRAPLGLTGLDQQFAEKMRFSRTAAAMHALVPGGLEQRLKILAVGIFRMDNDALNFVDQLDRAIIAVLDRLGSLAPAAIQNSVGGGDPRRRRAPWCCA